MRWLALLYFVAVVVSAPVTLVFLAYSVRGLFYDFGPFAMFAAVICTVITASSVGFLLDRQAAQIRKLKEHRHD